MVLGTYTPTTWRVFPTLIHSRALSISTQMSLPPGRPPRFKPQREHLLLPSGSAVTVSSLDQGPFYYYYYQIIHVCMYAKSLQSCPTLCDPLDYSPPGSSVRGMF